MPPPAFLALLEDLPLTTTALMRATLRAGRRLAEARVSTPAVAAPQVQFALRRAALDLRFFLSREGGEVRLFFSKQKQLPSRALAARLQVGLQAGSPAARADAPAASPQNTASTTTARLVSCRYRLLAPPFLFLRPTPAQLVRYAPEGTTAENGVLFRLGVDGRQVLGIRNPEAEQDAAAVYTARLRQPLGHWPSAPFLALVETLRAWLADGMRAAAEVELAMPSDPSALSDVHATVYWIVQAYQSLTTECARAAQALVPLPLRLLVPDYEVAEYVADIGLSMDNEGRFATAPTAALTLGLRLTLRQELGGPVAQVLLMPPDFLIAGALHAAFVAALRDDATRDLWTAVGASSSSEWENFVASASARMVLFRTDCEGRGKTKVDTNIAVLCGLWQNESRTLVLRTKAVVNVTAQPVGVNLASVVLVYDSQNSTQPPLDDRLEAYFMRFARSLQSWLTLWRPPRERNAQ